jgi:hypothetical protein
MGLYELLPLSVNHPSFRLLELDFNSDAASVDNATVHAAMDIYNFRNAPEYEALSYTWGTQDGSSNIKLNDQWFPVTPNLLAALQQLRLNQGKNGKSKRKLWIDAICINQSDNSEKSQQVMRMKDIYANASQVLVWIGKQDNLSGIAFDTLERFVADDGTRDGSVAYQDILDTVEERRAAIQLFIERSYFDRVWIIQEVVVARNATVLCGSFSIDFDMLHVAVQRMTSSGFYPFSIAASNVVFLGNWRGDFLEMASADREETLGLRLFMDACDRSATDLRDKIYSLRGIANNAIATGITVDYDNSVEIVYTDFTKHLLNLRHNLRVLSAVNLRHRTMSTLLLPSWVPDWSQPTHGGCILNRYYRFEPTKLFCAASTTKPQVTVVGYSDTICLKGMRLDTVKRVIRIKSILMAKDEDSISVTETRLREMAAGVTSLDTYPFTSEPFWRAFFRTLTADRTALSPRISEEYRAKFLTAFRDWKLNDEGAGQSPPARAWAEISNTIGAIIEYKDMFLTAQGYLGLSQEGFRIGDVVCIFSGGDVPYLLRQAMPPHDGMFQFLSECYVHGVMDGEAMNNLESNHLESFFIK